MPGIEMKPTNPEEPEQDGTCADMQCPTTQHRKICSLKEGIMDLDNILSTITKLCKDPNCAFAKTSRPTSADGAPCEGPCSSPESQTIAAPTTSSMDSCEDTPKPKVYNLEEEIDWNPIQKLCKHPICYSAYMGFRTPRSERPNNDHHHCGDEFCLGKSGKICKSKMCPFHPDFARKTDDLWKIRCPSYPQEPKLPPIWPQSPKRPETLKPCPYSNMSKMSPCHSGFTSSQANSGTCPSGVCGGSSCPFACKGINQILNDPKLETNSAAGVGACGNPCCPFSNPPPKAPCGNPTCPYSNKSKMSPCSPDFGSSVANNGTCPSGVCGGTTCPFACKGINQILNDPKLETNIAAGVGACGNPCCPFSNPPPKAPCGNPTCPYSNKSKMSPCPPDFGGSLANNGTCPSGVCGGTTCPFACKGINQILDDPNLETNIAAGVGACGNPCCPFSNPPPKAPCGNPTCPYSNKSKMSPCPPNFGSSLANKGTCPSGVCGGTSCPFACKGINQILNDPKLETNIAAGVGACGNPSCPYSNQSPGALCGSPSCPYSNIGNDCAGIPDDPCAPCCSGINGGLVPCPYAGEFKTYPCGSPSCPNVNPSGMIYTHYYANDYGFVQEAARPYCGSACPYDYMSSIENQYPKPYAENYNTFNIKSSSEMPSCPYLSNNGRRSRASDRRQITDTCNPKVCAYRTGTVERDSCGSINCEVNKPVNCTEKTCPNIEKFAFCGDCGGIIQESFDQELRNNINEAEVMSGLSAEADKISISKDLVVKEVSSAASLVKEESKIKEVAVVPKVQKPVKEKEEKPLYQYPGVQIGHDYCRRGYYPIPKNMGWAWNLQPPGSGNSELWRGYKPGAVTRTVYKMIMAHRKHYGIFDPNDLIKKRKSRTKFKLEDLKHCVELKKNKDGDYTITMNPLKDPTTLQPYENPFMDVSPMQFKVEKEKKEVDIAYCPCDVVTPSISSASSEIEFHFSPAAANPPTKQRKVKHLAAIQTQYTVTDLAPEFRGGKASKASKASKTSKSKGGDKKAGKGKKKK